MSGFFGNKRRPMKEISSEQVDKIEGKFGGWFYLVKVIIQPYAESEELIEWWKIHREGEGFERRMVSHAPTREIALQQIKDLNNDRWKPYKSLRWDLSYEQKQQMLKVEAEVEKIRCQQNMKKAKQLAEEAEAKKQRAVERKKRKKQKERIETIKKVGVTERFTGIEI